MIKEIDLKLISELDANGRVSSAELSRSLGISVSTVAKKISTLRKNGIIEIRAIPNPHRLGHIASAMIAIRTSVGKIEDVYKRLSVYPNIDLIVAIFGRFNLLVSAHFSSWDNLHDFISSELATIDYIIDKQIIFIKDNKRRFFDFPGKQNDERSILKIDKIDRQIIDALCIDGRYSVSYLAEILDLDISTVSKRLSHLFAENAIRVRANVDNKKIGYHSLAFILIHAQNNMIDSICRQIDTFEEVSTIITLINHYDIFVNAKSVDSQSLYDFINNKISVIPGVIDIEVWLRGKTFKTFFGSLPEK